MTMRVWLYARLSNDDDPAQNSLQNQQEICRAFAEKQGWTIAGSSTDDNISGMNFSRRGLDMLTAALQVKQIDAVLVKDLSRVYLKTHDMTGSEGFLRCARHFFAGILTYFKEK